LNESTHAREDSLFTVCSTVRDISDVKPRNCAQRGANPIPQTARISNVRNSVKTCAKSPL